MAVLFISRQAVALGRMKCRRSVRVLVQNILNAGTNATKFNEARLVFLASIDSASSSSYISRVIGAAARST